MEPFTAGLRIAADGCALAAGYNPDAIGISNQLITGTPAFERCLDENVEDRIGLALPYFATGILVILAVVLYVVLPYWKGRASRATALAAVDDQEGSLRAELVRLAAHGGLRRLPRFVVDPTSMRANAIVFGRLGRYTVRLDMGLVVLFNKDRSAFEATLLHEFAHLRHRDVDITYLTVAMWRVFAIGVLIPYSAVAGWYLVTVVLPGTAPNFFATQPAEMVRILAAGFFLVILTYLATADLLRTREFCADIEATINGADQNYWLRHAGITTRRDTRWRAALWAIRSVLHTHPDWTERINATRNPAALSVIQAMPMFLSGAITVFVGYYFSFNQANRLTDVGDVVRGPWFAAALALAVGGVAVWREVARCIRISAPPPSGLRAGLWLGAGQLGADLLVSPVAETGWLPPFPQSFLLVLLVLVPAALLWWIGACAALWGGLRSGRWRGVAAVVTLAVGGAGLAWWFDWWQMAGRFFVAGQSVATAEVLAILYGDMSSSPTMNVIAALTLPVLSLSAQPWTIWLTGALWVIPLVALIRRSRVTAAGGRSAGVVSGWLGGLAAGIGLIVVADRAYRSVQHDGQPVEQAATLATGWFFAILFCTAVVAAVSASLASRGDAAISMAAGGTAMAIGGLVLVGLAVVSGCAPWSTTRSMCLSMSDGDRQVLDLFLPQLLATSGMATLIGAAAGAIAVRLAVRGPRGRVAVSNAAARPDRVGARRVGTSLVCAVLVGVCAVAYLGTSGRERPGSTGATEPELSALFEPPKSAELRDVQVWAWAAQGGDDLFRLYHSTLGELFTSVGLDGRADLAAVRQACVALTGLSERADAYFPIPDSHLQTAWAAAMHDTHRAAQTCVTGIDRDDLATVSEAFNQLIASPDEPTCVEIEVMQATVRAQQLRGLPPVGNPESLRALCPR
ncbi:M48 family metalloprotease [Actinoalloteichus hymeniacidonis]|uniref:M48 family metalloprotease n=1 Tax=Actinoalloteichus hymeniacidonis TaxID=340345 RepID=UPI001560D1CA|nr:M48 family metalloprotease [Actinoalloteichus hymeniacidonis]MBB5907997.1 putative membrane-anchored protein [Actinoalloteichus hymeniacidonis]